MEEFENETNNEENKKKKKFKPLAFEEIKDYNINKDNINNINHAENENSNSESLSYNDLDFALAREFSGLIRENNPIRLLTSNIINLYKSFQKDYNFEDIEKPKRELTIPSEGILNDKNDNAEHDLIVCMDDIIKGPEYEYLMIDLLGNGISGQVFKCKRTHDEKFFAMKIIKNKKAHNCQALIELRILEFLNNKVDINDNYHIIRKYDHFYYKNHLCIVFELLNENLFELLKQNYFQGLSLNSIRFILKQILEALLQLQKSDLIHCDLKPENILLKIQKENKNEILIKVTDFGSACFKGNTFFQYIQSRYYRAPETIIGYPYSIEIDMWSLGCIAAELFLGEPLFPGSSEFDQLHKIVSFIGELPLYMLKAGKNTNKYYNVTSQSEENNKIMKRYSLKTLEEYFRENPNVIEPKYAIPCGLNSLDDILKLNNNKKNLNQSNTSVSDIHNSSHINSNDLESFVNFLKGLLTLDPKKRWNAKTALRHPFILKEKFTGNFKIEQNDEISMFAFNNQSFENSFLSDGGFNNMNNKFMKNNFANPNTLKTQSQNAINNLYIPNNNKNPGLNTGSNNNFNCKNISIQTVEHFNNININMNTQSFNPNYLNVNYFNNNNNKFFNVNPNTNSNHNQLNFTNNNFNNNQNKNYFSMIMNTPDLNSVDSESLNSAHSFNNQLIDSSVEYSCYQPNICNIPLNMLRNFPYGKIDNIDLKTNKKDAFKNTNNNKNPKQGKIGKNLNQTFTVDNFNTPGNNSFTNDYYNNHINYNYNNFYNNPNANNNIFLNNQNYNLQNNFAMMNLAGGNMNNFLNTSSDRFNKGTFNNINTNINNSYTNISIQDDHKNNSGYFPKNINATSSKFSHNNNLNNSINMPNINLNLNINSSFNSNLNSNTNVNTQMSNNNIVQKRFSDHVDNNNLSYFKNNENDTSSSMRDYEDLQCNDNIANNNKNSKGNDKNFSRGRSYSDYNDNKYIQNNTHFNNEKKSNFQQKNNYNHYNNSGETNFFKNNKNQKFNNSYIHNQKNKNNKNYGNCNNVNNNNNYYHSNSQKFGKNSKHKNISSQNTPVINNKLNFHLDEDVFLTTNEIKEEVDEEFNNNPNNKQTDQSR